MSAFRVAWPLIADILGSAALVPTTIRLWGKQPRLSIVQCGCLPYFWNHRTEAGLKYAVASFQQAIEADPTYALAYSGLADADTTLGYGSYLAPEAPPYPILSGMSRPRWAALHHSGALR